MRLGMIVLLASMCLASCASKTWDYKSEQAETKDCYEASSPTAVKACLDRLEVSDAAYPTTFNPGRGVFCTPDKTKKECYEASEKVAEAKH